MSSTADKIGVMVAFEAGEEVEHRRLVVGSPWQDDSEPSWNWAEHAWRVKPKTVTMYANLYLNRSLMSPVFGKLYKSEATAREFTAYNPIAVAVPVTIPREE